MLRLLAPTLLIALAACGSTQPEAHLPPKATTTPPAGAKPPTWAMSMEFDDGALCGLGVAGAGFYDDYPKKMARERAVRNLAGVLGTKVQEAIIDKETHRGISTQLVRVVTVDDALIQQVDGQCESEYWKDDGGTGPFAQQGFTYAKACMDAEAVASMLKVSTDIIMSAGRGEPISPVQTPSWIERRGRQAGGRLCAIGFSMPMFHPDKTFQAVVEDVRAQLAEVIRTLVSSYAEELETNDRHFYEMMTVASTNAVAEGVVVTDYWYDRDGIGPFNHKRTTYGWGCVYPVDVMLATLNDIEDQAPEDERDKIQKVRERAKSAFDELDEEIAQREDPRDPSPETEVPESDVEPPPEALPPPSLDDEVGVMPQDGVESASNNQAL